MAYFLIKVKVKLLSGNKMKLIIAGSENNKAFAVFCFSCLTKDALIIINIAEQESIFAC
jgi:hypothetical protein